MRHYSLGVVFYQMLTGELPVGHFAPPSKKVQIDVRLDEVVLRALEREPEKRYQQVSEVKTQIETIDTSEREAPHFYAELVPPPSGISDLKSQIPSQRFSRTAIAGAAWLCVSIFGALTIAGSPPADAPWWEQLLVFIVMFAAITSPFGVTVLGLISVSQIRRSAGQLYGLGLRRPQRPFLPSC